MDTLLYILAGICVLIGVVGCIVPMLPGPPICYLGLLLAHWAGADFANDMLLKWAAITVAVTVIDYFLPVWFTKTFGGSKAATWGSTIGIVIGLFFMPLGIIIGPFAGALIGELIHDRQNSAKAFKVALGSFAAFIFGTGMKLVAAVMMAIPIFKAVF